MDDLRREAPSANAPRLYVESLNSMIDSQRSRVAALNNRVPTPVLLVELVAPPPGANRIAVRTGLGAVSQQRRFSLAVADTQRLLRP
ncbi:MAG TPA: hypothetical protein VK204_08795 [Nocardioidaceae bacterium]|nr:hypothetical protein [Nocardioidaceae bacterium]